MNAGNARDLRTSRLLLRTWRDSDLVPFAAINADPLVAEHLPATLTREESDALVERIRAHWQEHGFGWWAVEVIESGELIGFAGLMRPSFEAVLYRLNVREPRGANPGLARS